MNFALCSDALNSMKCYSPSFDRLYICSFLLMFHSYCVDLEVYMYQLKIACVHTQ